MNVHFWVILIVLIMYKSWITTGFLLEKSTLAPQLSGGSVITDQHFLTLIELLSDEKQHRYQLEQKVAELEKRQGSVDQDSKISQMENYIKQLESRLTSVEQITALPVNNNSINGSETIAKLSKRIIDIELKYNALEAKYHGCCNNTEAQLNLLHQEVIDLQNMKTVNQIKTLNSLQKEVLTLNLKTNDLERTSTARSQDFLALFNYVTNNTMSISQIKNSMIMSELNAKANLNTTGKSLMKLECRQNQTYEYLNQLEHRHNVTHGELYSKMKKESEKVMLTACTSSYNKYNHGQVIKYDVIRANSGISDTVKFLSSGVFKCQSPGLYIVMVSMRGSSSDHNYYIKKNNTNMIFIQNVSTNGGIYRSVSGSFAVDLDVGDTIYVIPNVNVNLASESCLSVVKVK